MLYNLSYQNNQNTTSFKNLYFYIENNFLIKISSFEADKLDKNINKIAHEYCTEINIMLLMKIIDKLKL